VINSTLNSSQSAVRASIVWCVVIVAHVRSLSLLFSVSYPFGNCKKSFIKPFALSNCANCYSKLWQISCASRSWQLKSCFQLQLTADYSFNKCYFCCCVVLICKCSEYDESMREQCETYTIVVTILT